MNIICAVVALLALLEPALGAHYKVIVQTADYRHAGTDGKVFIKIYSGYGRNDPQTDYHELTSPSIKDPLEKGVKDTFDIYDNVDIGKIKGIELRRYGGNGWKLEYIWIVHKNVLHVFWYNEWVEEKKGLMLVVTGCGAGYKLLNEGICVDINECTETHVVCGTNAECVNMEGTHTCGCKTGYERENGNYKDQCVDRNECNHPGHGCEQTCINSVGSYKCECRSGYRLRNDGKCDNINECQENNPCVAPATCRDTAGSYECDCPSGYQKIGNHNCQDVNECAASHTNICDLTASTCVNRGGSYYCKCKTGYQQGSNDKECKQVICGPLASPYGGKIEPTQCLRSSANYYNQQCKYSCNYGYELVDPAVHTQTCGTKGVWLGALPQCNRVRCAALSSMTNGSVVPASCTSSGGAHTDICSYLCNSGYQLLGFPQRTCQADKTWTGTKPLCIEVADKPWISCPFDIMVDLLPGQKTANVSSQWKTPKSNVQKITVTPATATANFPYPSGDTKVTWSVKNPAGSDSCSILVIVNDKEAPKAAGCPLSPIQITTKTTSAAVTWAEPTFTDNVGVVKVTKTHQPGDMFSIGTVRVYYRANDKARNTAQCSFFVTVKREGCPDLEGPFNGDKSCSNFNGMSFCNVICPSGTVIYNNPSVYGFWSCDTGTWSPTDKVPDCVAATEVTDNSQPCDGNRVRITITSASGNKAYCAVCPTGTFQSNGACATCPAGQYQDSQNATACKACPSGTSSHPGASTLGQCRVVCSTGKVSTDGLEPGCQVCPADTYQNETQSTWCKKCPQGTSTLSVGSSTLSDCGSMPNITRVTPVSQTIDEGQSVSMSCFVTGTPRPALEWTFRKNTDAGFLGKMTRSMLKNSNGDVIGIKLDVTKATFDNNGMYVCSAVNSWGKVTSTSVLVVNKVIGG